MKKRSPPILIELPRMLNEVEEWRQLVRHALVWDLSGSTEGVERAIGAWRRLAAQLTPLIGEPGFSALYGRALRLTLPAHTIFSPAQPGQSSASLLVGLQENLNAAEEASAIDAVVTLMDTFTALLSALIGEPLTIKVLKSAWVVEPGSTTAKEASK